MTVRVQGRVSAGRRLRHRPEHGGLFTRLITADAATMLFWRGMFGALGLGVLSLILDRGRFFAGLRRMCGPGWLFAGVSALGMVCFIADNQRRACLDYLCCRAAGGRQGNGSPGSAPKAGGFTPPDPGGIFLRI